MKSFGQIIMFMTVFIFSACASKSVSQFTPGKSPIKIVSYSAGEKGFHVNSHLIVGSHDAILVDAQFTRSEARKLVRLVKDTGKNLKTIWITHAHPDHYFGLEILTKAFPSATVLTRAPILEEIRASASDKQKYWKAVYKNDLVQDINPVLNKISVFEGDRLTLDDQQVGVLDFNANESQNASALYVPGLRALISGDLVYNQVHLWLADKHGSVGGWKKDLKSLDKMTEIQAVYPGHGSNGNRELIAWNLNYVKEFELALHKSKDKNEAKNHLKSKFPHLQLPMIADLSVDAHF